MDIIRRKKPALIRWLRCYDSMILQHVDSRELVTTDEYNKLKNIGDPDKRNTELLDMILQKGPSVCSMFLDLLRENEVNESCPELREWIKTVNASGVAPEAGTPRTADNPNRTSSPARNQEIADNQEFLRKNRSALISKVKNVVEIVDHLELSDEMRAIVQAQETDHARMRKVLEYTNSKKAAELLVETLWNKQSNVMKELA